MRKGPEPVFPALLYCYHWLMSMCSFVCLTAELWCPSEGSTAKEPPEEKTPLKSRGPAVPTRVKWVPKAVAYLIQCNYIWGTGLAITLGVCMIHCRSWELWRWGRIFWPCAKRFEQLISELGQGQHFQKAFPQFSRPWGLRFLPHPAACPLPHHLSPQLHMGMGPHLNGGQRKRAQRSDRFTRSGGKVGLSRRFPSTAAPKTTL